MPGTSDEGEPGPCTCVWDHPLEILRPLRDMDEALSGPIDHLQPKS